MKKIIYISIFLFTGLMSSCADFLDKIPDDELTLEMVFGDKTRTEEWLAGIYSDIPDPYWGYAREIGFDTLSDDLQPSNAWIPYSWQVISMRNGNWSTATEWAPQYWKELPSRIRAAHILIENVRPNIDQKFTQQEATNMKYEARFMIAYYYSLLIDVYGPIPFTPDVVYPTDAPANELGTEQRPLDEIIDWIDKELIELSRLLPEKYDNNKFGRATSIMCLAVRARMLLFAASPLVNGNPDYANHKNTKGEPLFSTSYDPSKWSYAAKACKELLDAAEEAGHKLYYEYNDDGSIDPFLSYQNMMFKRYSDGNTEILFARPNCNIKDYGNHATPRGASGNGGLGVTQSLVDAFFMKDGKTIYESGLYSEKGFSTTAEFREDTKWSEVKSMGQITLENTYNMYCNREPRFYISVLYNGCWYRQDNRLTQFMSGQRDGGPSFDSPESGYLVRKKVHPDHNKLNSNYPYRPGILYRMGEAYLNYAEALNESSPGNPDILKYVNLIRERAGIPGLDESYLADQNKMRKAIQQERRVELNCEGIRYRDLRRWKIAEEVLTANFDGMNFYGTEYSDDKENENAYFKRRVSLTRTFTKKNYWFPVPVLEIEKNENLVQNPFWN